MASNNVLRFADTHFYLISLDKVHKLLVKLTTAEADSHLTKVWANVEPRLRTFRDARNQSAYMEKEFDVYGPGFGTFTETTWTYRGKRFEIGADSFREAAFGFQTLIAAIKDSS